VRIVRVRRYNHGIVNIASGMFPRRVELPDASLIRFTVSYTVNAAASQQRSFARERERAKPLAPETHRVAETAEL
jgi:hypothetical protein